MEHRIYCAVHWPFDGICGEEREQARKNGDELISLPIDQRYGIELRFVRRTMLCQSLFSNLGCLFREVKLPFRHIFLLRVYFTTDFQPSPTQPLPFTPFRFSPLAY